MEADSQQLYADALTGELGRELENGRLLRVLVKLSTATERPEHDSDPQWSETGTHPSSVVTRLPACSPREVVSSPARSILSFPAAVMAQRRTR